MLTLRKTLTLTVAAALLLFVGFAQAAKAGERDAAYVLGKKIVEAAHPTGVGHELRKYSMRGDTVYLTIDWKGGFLGTPYTSEIEVTFTTTRGKVKIASIDYEDDAVIAYNRNNIRQFIYNFNQR